MNLEEIRKNMDEVDLELISLFKRRMDLSSQVADYKKAHNKPVFDENREKKLLSRVSDLSGEDLEEYIRQIYGTILNVSKDYQTRKLGNPGKTVSEVQKALENTEKVFPKKATVACQGIEGAYSEMAANRLFSFSNIFFFKSFEKVFQAIESGMCRYGVLPIENSTAGSVKTVYDLMISHNFKIVRSVRLKIDHNLLAKKGTKIEDIREIFSHRQALDQCAGFLEGLPQNIKITEVENTAMAARMVAESERTDVASLSSAICAPKYGLEILKSSVEDHQNNHTRFICIAKETEIYPGADRTGLMMVLPHKPGSLFNVLSKFNARSVNLLKLESRPIPTRDFEFMFYFDLEVSVYSEEFQSLLSELERENGEFTYLGSYSEII